MNTESYDNQYPVDRALDIESRCEGNEVKSKEHGIAAQTVYASGPKGSISLCETDTERECPKTQNSKAEECYSDG